MTNTTIRQVGTTSLAVVAFALLACAVQERTPPTEFRKDGCGAARKLAQGVNKVCEYSLTYINGRHPGYTAFEKVECIDGADLNGAPDDAARCTYKFTAPTDYVFETGCYLDVPEAGDLDGNPCTNSECAAYTPDYTDKLQPFSFDIHLETGSTLCDPGPGGQADTDALTQLCAGRLRHALRGGGPAETSCEADRGVIQGQYNYDETIECCVPDAYGAGADTGGGSSGESGSSSAGAHADTTGWSSGAAPTGSASSSTW